MASRGRGIGLEEATVSRYDHDPGVCIRERDVQWMSRSTAHETAGHLEVNAGVEGANSCTYGQTWCRWRW